uniref:Cms1 ribosomal small subunit homolog n=1 Tax=Cyprinus carpio TaxID=7962 RepID=A0A8C1XRW1_CYPCA
MYLRQKRTEETGDKESNKNKKGKNYNSHKTITDVLTSSEPVPGSPADLLSLLKSHHSQTRSVIEQEELTLSKSCFLSCNDLTHSSSCYLKEVCLKWAKIQKQHTQTRTIDLIKQLIVFKGQAKVLKLFVKHIKVDCCDKVIGLRYLVLDWNYRD